MLGRMFGQGRTYASRAVRAWRFRTVEALESREMLSTMPPNVVVDSATTADSKSVTIDYDVQNTSITQPIQFGVYRSDASQLDITSVSVGTVTSAAGSVGHHEVTLPIPGGLPLNPKHPYVVVVADPKNLIAETSKADNTASFRTYSLAIIVHGGLQPSRWAAGPPWELRMADALRAQGYDLVIPFNWVRDSNDPGATIRQGQRLTSTILTAAGEFPQGAPLDLQLIGHSEGAVIVSQAALALQSSATPALRAGYFQLTLLDPHPANNNAPGQEFSVSHGILGTIAYGVIKAYQAKAHDPEVTIPPNVDSTVVFYQHTPVSEAATNHGIYNLWGQVPVNGPAVYFNLTGRGLSHAGRFSVHDWYQINVVPTLGDGAQFLTTDVLTGARIDGTTGLTYPDRRATYAGKAAPGATVKVLAGPIWTHNLAVVGRTKASPSGTWQITTDQIPNGTYRIMATATAPAHPLPRAVSMQPTVWMTPLVVFAKPPAVKA